MTTTNLRELPKPVDTSPEGTTLTEQVYSRLREAIVTCQYMPGSELSEAIVAERFGVGKAPVRAALARLVQDGLVRGHPLKKRSIVAPLTTEDMLEVFQLRLLLEPRAAALAAGHLEPDHIVRMTRSIHQRPSGNSAESRISFLQSNRLFHSTIAQASRNRRLEGFINRLLDDVERMLHLGYAGAPQAAAYHEEHHALLQVLIAGDAQAAETMAYQQIAHGQEIVLKKILEQKDLLVQENPPGRSPRRKNA